MGRKFYFLIAITLTILIGYGSLISIGNNIPKTVYFSDKIIHSLAYFSLTISWLLVFKKNLKNKLLILIMIFSYGIIIETLQGSLTAYRQFDLKDLLANFVGIVFGFTIFNYFLQKKLFN